MADLIRFNPHLQAFECSECTQMHEVRKHVARDPDKLFEMKQRLTHFHAKCQEAIDTRNRLLMWSRPFTQRQARVM